MSTSRIAHYRNVGLGDVRTPGDIVELGGVLYIVDSTGALVLVGGPSQQITGSSVTLVAGTGQVAWAGPVPTDGWAVCTAVNGGSPGAAQDVTFIPGFVVLTTYDAGGAVQVLDVGTYSLYWRN